MFSIRHSRPLQVNRFAVYISIDAVAPCVIIERLSIQHQGLCKVSIIGMQVTSASAATGKPMHLETSETKHLVGSGSKRKGCIIIAGLGRVRSRRGAQIEYEVMEGGGGGGGEQEIECEGG